jgi:hypothetical protein
VLERASYYGIAALAIVFNLSTGAIPGFSKRMFQFIQTMILLAYAYNYYLDWLYANDPDYPALPFTFLFLGHTTVREVQMGASTTAAFFIAKQLLKSLLRPQYSQLLQPRYKIEEYPSPASPG